MGNKYDLLSYEIKKYVKDNPEDADNCEDLFNWALSTFRGLDKNEEDLLWDFIRQETSLPK